MSHPLWRLLSVSSSVGVYKEVLKALIHHIQINSSNHHDDDDAAANLLLKKERKKKKWNHHFKKLIVFIVEIYTQTHTTN